MTVAQIKSRIASIIHAYEWACDHGYVIADNTTEIIIEQLNTLLTEIEKETINHE
jgi:hypothetical protein